MIIHCLTQLETEKDPVIVYGAYAYVNYNSMGLGPEDYTVFMNPACNIIKDLWRGKSYMWTWNDTVFAVLAVTHESGHLRGRSWPMWNDEGQVNMWALKRSWPVALKFGMPEERKEEFQKELLVIWHRFPHEYRPSQCANPVLDEDFNIGCHK